MHHSAQHVLVLVILRRRNLRPRHAAGGKNRVCIIFSGAKICRSAYSSKRLARYPLHQRAQHNKINVAVGKLRSRRILRRLRKRHPVRRLLPFPRRLQIQIRLQPRVVRQATAAP